MPDRVYTLERLNWRPNGPASLWLAAPGADPLVSFADRADAEAAARDREWAVRRRVNPFDCGGPLLHYQTTFDAARLHDWFLDLGLDPPAPTTDSGDWGDFWERADPHLTDLQRAGAWEALNRVRFFRVVERPAGRPTHLVATPHYEWDPILKHLHGQPSRYVGCTPYMLAGHVATADRLCHELYTDYLARTGDWHTHEPDSWLGPDPDLLAGEEMPLDPWYGYGAGALAEHRPLDLVADRDPTPGRTLYAVLCRHWRLEISEDGFWRWSPTEARTCGRPVAAFDTLAAADARVAELEAEARTHPAPFRFGPALEWSTWSATALFGVLNDLARIDFTSLWTDYTAPDRLWAAWWDAAVPTLSAADVAFVWSLFDKLKFYEVVEVEYRD